MELRADLIPRENRNVISNHVLTSVQNTDHTHSTKGKANNNGRSSKNCTPSITILSHHLGASTIQKTIIIKNRESKN